MSGRCTGGCFEFDDVCCFECIERDECDEISSCLETKEGLLGENILKEPNAYMKCPQYRSAER